MSRRKLFAESLEPRRLLAADMVLHNPLDALDVDHNRVVVPLDALVVINEVNKVADDPDAPITTSAFVDTNNDDFLSPADALKVINFLNDPSGDSDELAERIHDLAERLDAHAGEMDGEMGEVAKDMARYAAEHDEAVEVLHRQLDEVMAHETGDAADRDSLVDQIAAARRVNESVLELRMAYLDDHVRDDFAPFAEEYMDEVTDELTREWTDLFDDAEHNREWVERYLEDTMESHHEHEEIDWTMDDVVHGDIPWDGVIPDFFDEVSDKLASVDIESLLGHVQRALEEGQIEINEHLAAFIKPYLANPELIREQITQWLESEEGMQIAEYLSTLHDRLASGEHLGLSDLEPIIARLMGDDHFPLFGVA